ncbi:MAG: tetratricopeptide repeat protein [Bacteroidales bacterium]|nr:tetratricopeptide repeat protein [Bacteroidales bacterium]
MKKIILLTAISLSFVFSAYAQRGERTDAYLALQKGKLKEAKEAIDQAVKNEKTMNDAKTWLYYGEIYYGIATSPLPVFRNLDANAAQKALDGLQKAKKLDEKNKIVKEADDYIGKLSAVFYTNGANDFKVKDYNKAITDFEQAFKIAGMLGKTDTTAAYNIGISGVLANQPKVAAEYLKKCIDLNFKDPKVFIFYARSLKQMGDTTGAMQALTEGRGRYPKELSILLEQAQVYLEQGKSEQLIASLKEAISKEPNNPGNANFYFLIGKSYDDSGNKVEAENYYKKAIDVNPNFFEAYYNIGAIFVNKASNIQKQANDLPLDKVKEYNALNDSANVQLQLALPWLEKSLSIRPGDKLSTTALKEAYTRLKMYDKLKALNANQ